MIRPLFKYRITKYDPKRRNHLGRYQVSEWTSYSDIGKVFEGVPLKEAAYEKTENAYISAVLAFVAEAGAGPLTVCGWEDRRKNKKLAFLKEGAIMESDQDITSVVRGVLREEIWCRLQGKENFFVHFGWDYYMYLGVNSLCAKAIQNAEERGLFVESLESPYLK